jgi:hypothetical protein
MENMRALIDKDPQAEGYFSAYSPALGRVALRKARYLESNPAGTVSESAADVSSNGNYSNNIHSSTASNKSTSMHPGGESMPVPPNSKPAPAGNSIFGDKLQQALHDERK